MACLQKRRLLASHIPSHPPKDRELVGSFNPFEKYLKPPTGWCFMLIAPISAPLTRKVLKKKRFVTHASAATWYLNTSRYHKKKRAHQPKPRWTHHQFLSWKPSRLSTASPHHIGSESSPKTFKAIFIPNLSIDDMPRCLPSITPSPRWHPWATELSLQPARWVAMVDQPSCLWSRLCHLVPILDYAALISTLWIWYKRNTHKISMAFSRNYVSSQNFLSVFLLSFFCYWRISKAKDYWCGQDPKTAHPKMLAPPSW